MAKKLKFNALRFQKRRIELGLTLNDVATRISATINETAEVKVHVGVATVSRWENGKFQPSKRYMPAIYKVLHTNSGELLTAGR